MFKSYINNASNVKYLCIACKICQALKGYTAFENWKFWPRNALLSEFYAICTHGYIQDCYLSQNLGLLNSHLYYNLENTHRQN